MASMPSAAPVAAPTQPTQPTSIHVPAWAWAMAALALFTVYLLSQENGALLPADAAQYLHEFTHDARHALGAPCH